MITNMLLALRKSYLATSANISPFGTSKLYVVLKKYLRHFAKTVLTAEYIIKYGPLLLRVH